MFFTKNSDCFCVYVIKYVFGYFWSASSPDRFFKSGTKIKMTKSQQFLKMILTFGHFCYIVLLQ